MDGIWVFIGAGGGIGALVGLALMAPAILPRLFDGGNKATAASDRLQATVSLYERLDEVERTRLENQTALFLKKKKLSAEGGKLPPILAAAIAGNACLLRLQPKADCYPDLREVVLIEGPTQVSGKRIELNWSEVQNGLGSIHNPVIRAFAQILRDTQTGGSKNRSGAQYPEKWQREFEAASQEIKIDESAVFASHGEYASNNLFLSGCEAYFQQGNELAKEHHTLYALFREFFVVESARN